jgi:hypothetical protein
MSLVRTTACWAAFFVLGLTGCGAPLSEHVQRRDHVLGAYFTDDAAAVLTGVPLRTTPAVSNRYRGIAIGDDFLTRAASILLGLGNARQVVVVAKFLDDDGLIIHEYLHQADYSGLIDRKLFLERFHLLKTDPEYMDYALHQERSIAQAYGASIFGRAELLLFDGMNVELLAFVGRDIATGDLTPPDYLREPFAHALRMPSPTVPPVSVIPRYATSAPASAPINPVLRTILTIPVRSGLCMFVMEGATLKSRP